MRPRLVPVALGLLLALALPPAASGGTPAPAAPELTRLLLAFLDGAGRNDAAMHDRFWADDLIYTGSSGRRVGKADIMSDVKSAPAPGPAIRSRAMAPRTFASSSTATRHSSRSGSSPPRWPRLRATARRSRSTSTRASSSAARASGAPWAGRRPGRTEARGAHRPRPAPADGHVARGRAAPGPTPPTSTPRAAARTPRGPRSGRGATRPAAAGPRP